jgi:hypothetical protein
LFKLLDANTQAALTQFIYDITQIFVEPFGNVFEPVSLGENNVIELGALFSFFLILFIGVVLVEIISAITGSNFTVYRVVRRG